MCHIISLDNKGFIVVTFIMLSCLVHQLYGIGGEVGTTTAPENTLFQFQLNVAIHPNDFEQSSKWLFSNDCWPT